MSKKVFYDGDMYFAMLKSMNEDLNIDPTTYEAIEAINEMAEKEEVMRWYGMVYNFNGLDIRNIKHPFFEV